MASRWYVIHVFSGFEKKVAQSIREQADKQGIGDHIQEVLVPTEEAFQVRRGQKVKSESKFFPGYVLVQMDMTDHAWNLVKNTPLQFRQTCLMIQPTEFLLLSPTMHGMNSLSMTMPLVLSLRSTCLTQPLKASKDSFPEACMLRECLTSE